MVQTLTEDEWNIARHFRQKYFFDKDHLHLVLYRDAYIIDYAHIQLWTNLIVIDSPYRNKMQFYILMNSHENLMREIIKMV